MHLFENDTSPRTKYNVCDGDCGGATDDVTEVNHVNVTRVFAIARALTPTRLLKTHEGHDVSISGLPVEIIVR